MWTLSKPRPPTQGPAALGLEIEVDLTQQFHSLNSLATHLVLPTLTQHPEKVTKALVPELKPRADPTCTKMTPR